MINAKMSCANNAAKPQDVKHWSHFVSAFRPNVNNVDVKYVRRRMETIDLKPFFEVVQHAYK